MKHVVCFGDSNTWGYVPGPDGQRYDFEDRYPGILQDLLGPEFRVHEEGLNGRMTAWDDPHTADRNALRQMDALLETHRPMDALAIMLGTNDLKRYMHLEAVDCALGLDVLIDRIEAARCGRGGARPALLIIAPPRVVDSPTPFGRKFEDAIRKSGDFAAAYAEIARNRGCRFLDAGAVVEASTRDGIHLEKAGHKRLAQAVAPIIRDVLAAV
jgi:lysophospholipase L1-like esterase